MGARPFASGPGEEYARAIGGARKTDPDDLERACPRANGERVRGRSGRVEGAPFERGETKGTGSGAVARLGVQGLRSGVCGASSSCGGGGGKGLSVILCLSGI